MAEIVNTDPEEASSKVYTEVGLSDGQAAFIAERTGELTVFPGSSVFG